MVTGSSDKLLILGDFSPPEIDRGCETAAGHLWAAPPAVRARERDGLIRDPRDPMEIRASISNPSLGDNEIMERYMERPLQEVLTKPCAQLFEASPDIGRLLETN